MPKHNNPKTAHHKAVYMTLAVLTGAGLVLDAKATAEALKLVCYLLLAR